MGNLLTNITGVFKYHKLKIFVMFLAFVASAIWLAPFDDLGDLATSKIAELTQNQIFVQFDHMGISLIPQPGVSFEKVYLETPFSPPIHAGKLSVAPHIPSLLLLKPGVSAYASDVFGGNVSLSTSPDSSSTAKKGEAGQKLNLQVEDVRLGEILQMAGVPIKADGQLSLETQGVMDLNLISQPTATINLNVKKVSLPSNNVPTPMGPLTLPDIGVRSIAANGDLKNGKLSIEKLTVGETGDELTAQIKGQMDVQLFKTGGSIGFRPGAYDLDIQIQAKPGFQSKAGFFLSFLKSYQKANSPLGASYGFRISAPNFYSPPKMVAN